MTRPDRQRAIDAQVRSQVIRDTSAFGGTHAREIARAAPREAWPLPGCPLRGRAN